MNERIRELIKECTIDIESFDAEKFAELIVRECLSSLENAREMYANPGTYEPREYYVRMDAKFDAICDAIADLKSQFGIK